jgi:succinate dehydrogenase/fumarate reductase flavoprotein subunit
MRDGRVAGIVVERDGQEVTIHVRRAVVLGSGGFSHDEALKRKLIPFPDQHQTICPETNSGDGLHMGMATGGRMGDGDRTFHNYLGSQVSMMRDRSGC